MWGSFEEQFGQCLLVFFNIKWQERQIWLRVCEKREEEAQETWWKQFFKVISRTHKNDFKLFQQRSGQLGLRADDKITESYLR